MSFIITLLLARAISNVTVFTQFHTLTCDFHQSLAANHTIAMVVVQFLFVTFGVTCAVTQLFWGTDLVAGISGANGAFRTFETVATIVVVLWSVANAIANPVSNIRKFTEFRANSIYEHVSSRTRHTISTVIVELLGVTLTVTLAISSET
jgi:uncharacterized protein YigA (DUF484 family)